MQQQCQQRLRHASHVLKLLLLSTTTLLACHGHGPVTPEPTGNADGASKAAARPVRRPPPPPPPGPQCHIRVAVVGGGIGGAFAAYFLRVELAARNLTASTTCIDVYEASSEVGGRVKEFKYGSQTLELGASVFWDHNQYVRRAAQELGLALKEPAAPDPPPSMQPPAGSGQAGRAPASGSSGDIRVDAGAGDDGFGVFDGRRMVASMTGSWRDSATAAVRYGPAALRYISLVKRAARRFAGVYALQDEGAAFESPQDLLARLGGLDGLTASTCEQYLQEQLVKPWYLWGGKAFAEEAVGAVNRCNYNQPNSALSALAGLVSFAPAAYGDVWAIQGGNRQLVTGLLNASNARVTTGAQVHSIALRGRTPRGTPAFEVRVELAVRPGGSCGAGLQQQPASGVATHAHSTDAARRSLAAEGDGPVGDAGGYSPGTVHGHGHGRARDDGVACDARPGIPSGCEPWSADEQQQQEEEQEEERGASAHRPSLSSSFGRSIAAGAMRYRCRYDGVVLATALELSSNLTLDLKGSGQPPAPLPQRAFQPTTTTYVLAARLRPEFFGAKQLPVQQVLVTSHAPTPFSAIGYRRFNESMGLYKVFSIQPLPPNLTAAMFEGPQVLYVHAWAGAYPRFSPPERFAPFLLAPGLAYSNAIENAASAMEMSAVAARNSALLVANHVVQQLQLRDSTTQDPPPRPESEPGPDAIVQEPAPLRAQQSSTSGDGAAV